MSATTPLSLLGKVALITGASSGIGAATSVLFAKLGAKLVLNGRQVENLEKTGKDCEKHGAKPLIVPGDVTKEADNVALIQKAVEHFGKLDILVNNAGILALGTIETTSLQDFDHMMNTNVRSVFHLTSLAVPHLTKTQGNIVNVSSVNGLRSFPGVLAYCVSKSAVDQMTHCVALEMAPKKVRVNCVNPGVIVTELQKRGGLNEEAYAAFLEKSKTTHALGRAGEADEVANAIAFLASDSASFITGVTLPVDGGRHAMCPR
ncbi:3-oxoacyl-[acyl-carrier-protein] reductase FabG-like [Antedon mediterranea]|uniref:3-oxoacyl-[acyl-carrier-protein] reductase FabG-like n=1 Tax=Antedon mediterranea TaxID=105859 RepID=UPI003AF9727F